MRGHKEDRLFWTAVLLCTLYLCYRYPLQVNDSGTSPTYADTPLFLQVGKFILLLPLFAVAMLRSIEKSLTEKQWFIVGATLFLSVFSMTKLCNNFDARYFQLSFWMLFPLILVWGTRDIGIEALDRYFRFVFILCLASSALQLFLFFSFGRLPALAYEGTIFVRFGGFLDDPNGFAAILFLVLGWADKRYAGLKRILAVGGIGAALLFTQSWTAIAFLVLICLIRAILGMRRHFVLSTVGLVCVGLILSRAYGEIQHSYGSLLDEILNLRQLKVEQHSFAWSIWGSKWYEWFLIGDSKYNFYEFWWASAAVNFGVPWLVTFLTLTTLPLSTLWKAASNASPEHRPIYSGILLFQIYCLIGSFNLPFVAIFPVNFLFFVFLYLLEFKRIRLTPDFVAGGFGGSVPESGNPTNCIVTGLQ